jgi:hypothetical protein
LRKAKPSANSTNIDDVVAIMNPSCDFLRRCKFSGSAIEGTEAYQGHGPCDENMWAGKYEACILRESDGLISDLERFAVSTDET